ncbi:Utp14p Ecym_8152 [Eremothecium cymbalariae DBVPG|uniref:U3 small nucleolar RNA-associated protein 14 n=1 Tax=Eremothecium cymbalariae (strain CBS 270.75 / DBVPG 7215 / KCTC 17166 / NRRL Y-17582) TaxID=931890 RepID=G8JX66_ERECY|nr:Hypothetical protein Ecym_8152 [Eremothecium cymbalariae DBVPG\
MAKKRTRTKTSISKRRIQNALELATREVGGDNDSSGEYSNDRKRNGTIINAQGQITDDEEGDFEDEDIDSDEAFGSDEDIDVLNSKFSQTIRDKKKDGTYVADEFDEEGGYTSIDEDDLMPLSAVWDMDKNMASEASSSDERAIGDLELNDDIPTSSDDDDEESEEEEEEEEEEDNPFNEILEEDVDLPTVAQSLKKPAEKLYRKLDTYAGGLENEFALPSAQGPEKLDISKMLSVVDDQEAVQNATLLKGDLKALDVPLPQRIQKRHERKAAYEISKDEVSRWSEVVQTNRKAEHLSFPLNGATRHDNTTAFIRSSEKELTEVETKVNEVLKQSNLVDTKKESTFEEIAVPEMSPEDMRKRTAELRLMRELMFREERKAKRIKKIKSKAYRRIKKKELLKSKELVESDESADDHDVARAKERMTLKHKTQSKWAKDMIKHGMTQDKETREELEEMLQQGERLRAKITGQDDKDEYSATCASDIERDEEAYDKKDEFQKGKSIGKTGVLNMAFMRNAEAREREENEKNMSMLRAVERGEDIKLFKDDIQENLNIQTNQGRRVYKPTPLDKHLEDVSFNREVSVQHKEEESRTLKNRLTSAHERKALNKLNRSKATATEDRAQEVSKEGSIEANPWLDGSDDEEYVQKSSKVNVVDKSSSQFTKTAHKIEKEKQKVSKSTKKGKDHEELLLDIEHSNRLEILDPYGGSDDEKGEFTFKQQDVISEAFAGDDVVAKFEQEKKRVTIDEDDKQEDITLPGWGDWAGAGAKTKKRKFVKTIKGVVGKDKRRDKNLKNVIINEKVNKKNLKYQSSAVPFPFESREQYERSLRMPLGQEWTPRTLHQKMIKPRILTKPSQVIHPLEAPFK